MTLFDADQMTRDADAQTLVDMFRKSGQPSLSERGVDAARSYIEERAAASGPAVDVVRDVSIPAPGRSIFARLYRPNAAASLPTVVYFHGGGWVVGSVRASDAFCRRLALTTPCAVLSVEYRLAPEHPFPAGIEDAVAAIEWATEFAADLGGDPARLVVLGDSAGGNVATVAVRRVVAKGSALIARQILAYPTARADRENGNAFGAEWPLTHADRQWFLDQYVTDEQLRTHPDVAPLHADVTGMPPTTLLVGGCDPLREEGLAYAEHLWSAGVSVDLHFYPGQIHGFLTLDPAILKRSQEALGVVANSIRNL